MIQDVEQMIQDRMKKMQDIKQAAEVRKIYSSLCSYRNTRNWSEIKMKTQESVETLRRALNQLQDTLHVKLKQAVLKKIQQYAVYVTLDPDTAYPYLILSSNGKRKILLEVEVMGRTAWVLGVARESINRGGRITLRPSNGYWTVWLRNGDEYSARENWPISLNLRMKPHQVGVFVDYEEGVVSFHDVVSGFHIYSFTVAIAEKATSRVGETPAPNSKQTETPPIHNTADPASESTPLLPCNECPYKKILRKRIREWDEVKSKFILKMYVL
ncbi:E3 ubiquitin- ligase TRIM39-like protein [Labeo rohita]|uniref:E3 ubiquitin-ligase TRIM39-like protein n=1 Tax=Labeo rohita TaxID=84645 RepID=A0A498LD94_LABRO|nr:E3 ubiquitin- ligase TRIM39-like protein [Labeo rohita]